MSKETRKFFSYLKLKRVLMLNALVFGVVAYGFGGEYLRNRSLEQEIDRLKAQAEAIEAKNLELAALSRRFSNTDAIEREARVKLGLRKPGESVIIVQGSSAKREQEKGSNPEYQPRLSNPQKWWKYFFH